jgi:phthiodiolone/phenolphthiodiolone dimycocerosates ketoreductase
MQYPRIAVGLSVGTSPPVGRTNAMVRAARTLGAESVWLVDHFSGFFPRSVWSPEFTWMAGNRGSTDAFFDWQVMAGGLAGRVGRMRIGIGVTEAVRRHPVVLAQAALTLGHLTKRAPILGIGSGEAENIVPYGLSFRRPVSRLEEALQVIRLCFAATGPIEFDGEFFSLDGALFDLRPAEAGPPSIWVAAHGPRMLDLTGRYGDGWYPAVPMSPDAYSLALERVKAAAFDVGRDPGRIVGSMQAFYLVGRNDADIARQLAHPAVGSWHSWPRTLRGRLLAEHIPWAPGSEAWWIWCLLASIGQRSRRPYPRYRATCWGDNSSLGRPARWWRRSGHSLRQVCNM